MFPVTCSLALVRCVLCDRLPRLSYHSIPRYSAVLTWLLILPATDEQCNYLLLCCDTVSTYLKHTNTNPRLNIPLGIDFDHFQFIVEP